MALIPYLPGKHTPMCNTGSVCFLPAISEWYLQTRHLQGSGINQAHRTANRLLTSLKSLIYEQSIWETIGKLEIFARWRRVVFQNAFPPLLHQKIIMWTLRHIGWGDFIRCFTQRVLFSLSPKNLLGWQGNCVISVVSALISFRPWATQSATYRENFCGSCSLELLHNSSSSVYISPKTKTHDLTKTSWTEAREINLQWERPFIGVEKMDVF